MRFPGGEVAGWRLTGVASESSLNIVFGAEHPDTRQRVAVLVPNPGILAYADVPALWLEMARRLKQDAPPNAPRVLETGTWNEVPYCVQEWVDGVPASALLGDDVPGAPLEVREALAVALAAAEMLHALHGPVEAPTGIFHGTLSTAKIAISSEGRVVVVGTPLPLGHDWIRPHYTDVARVSWLAPEQVGGDAVDTRADVYTLALVTRALLTGENPLQRATAAATTAAILSGEIGGSEVYGPPELSRVLKACLSLAAEDRPASVVDLRDALAAALAAAGGAPDTEAWVRRARDAGDSRLPEPAVDVAVDGLAIRALGIVSPGSAAGEVTLDPSGDALVPMPPTETGGKRPPPPPPRVRLVPIVVAVALVAGIAGAVVAHFFSRASLEREEVLAEAPAPATPATPAPATQAPPPEVAAPAPAPAVEAEAVADATPTLPPKKPEAPVRPSATAAAPSVAAPAAAAAKQATSVPAPSTSAPAPAAAAAPEAAAPAATAPEAAPAYAGWVEGLDVQVAGTRVVIVGTLSGNVGKPFTYADQPPGEADRARFVVRLKDVGSRVGATRVPVASQVVRGVSVQTAPTGVTLLVDHVAPLASPVRFAREGDRFTITVEGGKP